ncbi:hypothetical protein [Herpetosiphon geysericola]|uniref:Uncharacterized protein n=1 Tax=Herpetosiphon geysericola TaxID=70996 RepID=A0A0P6XR60_9CHLR|nr:hypothetical protein [Herpetosiphon geysericola]KPL84933.1 hypothetical protein SE18_18845 [Herpetosiphon geysericola]
MWLQRFSSYLVVFGFVILIWLAGAFFLTVGAPFLSFGSGLLIICGAILWLIVCFWPIIGAMASWRGLGLFYQPAKKPHYWGLGLLCVIYGIAIFGFLIKNLGLGYWIFFGNSLGIILRSIFVEWRVAEGRVLRLSINLLLAIGLPLMVTGFLWFLA